MIIKKEIKSVVEMDVNIPFYAHKECDLEEIFVKITQTEFQKITLKFGLGCECIKTRFNGEIADIWLNNECDFERWSDGVKMLRQYVDAFN